MEREKLIELKNLLDEFLSNAPSEDECSDFENDLYADMQNLFEDLENIEGLEEV